MKTTTNTVDLTSMTERAMDAVLAWKAGDSDFDFDVLTVRELRDLGAAVKADLKSWIYLAQVREDAQARARRADRAEAGTIDYEHLIMLDQDDARA